MFSAYFNTTHIKLILCIYEYVSYSAAVVNKFALN